MLSFPIPTRAAADSRAAVSTGFLRGSSTAIAVAPRNGPVAGDAASAANSLPA